MKTKTNLLVALFIGMGIIFLSTQCANSSQQPDAEQGAQLVSDNCAFCHADSGESNGPTLAMINQKYEEAALQTYLMDHFVEKKNMGSSFQHQSVMLSEEGVQSVTAYIKQLGVEGSSN
jgi:cytochrome c553